jgi:hypothetical protein
MLDPNRQDNISRTSTFNRRQKKLWELFCSLEFGTRKGPQTVKDNVSDPERLCLVLGGDYYKRVDIDKELHTAAAWTLSRGRNHKSNLGMFLTKWFNRVLDKLPKDVQNKPGYHRPFGE